MSKISPEIRSSRVGTLSVMFAHSQTSCYRSCCGEMANHSWEMGSEQLTLINCSSVPMIQELFCRSAMQQNAHLLGCYGGLWWWLHERANLESRNRASVVCHLHCMPRFALIFPITFVRPSPLTAHLVHSNPCTRKNVTDAGKRSNAHAGKESDACNSILRSIT